MKNLKPLLKWVGGKYGQKEICEAIAKLYAPYRETHIWFEPFCGGLGMTHQINPDKAILSDSNMALIGFYRSVKAGVRFIDACNWPYEDVRSRLNEELARVKQIPLFGDTDPDLLINSELMSMFYVVNKRAFNGVWRVNSKGYCNIPEGRDASGNRNTVEVPNLKPYRDRFADWTFKPWSWERWLRELTPEQAFVYFDPPYDGSFDGYTAEGFSWADQVALADWAGELVKNGHEVAISNAATDRICDLYQRRGLEVRYFGAKRSVSRDGNRAKAAEILATSELKGER